MLVSTSVINPLTPENLDMRYISFVTTNQNTPHLCAVGLSKMSEEVKESECEEEDVAVCEVCGGTPCEWEEFGIELMENMKMMYDHGNDGDPVKDRDGNIVANSTVRKGAYKLFTYMKFGHLGKGNRIPIPHCVTKKIRERYPEPDGNYMGFQRE
jgi:hypothetical protein